MFQNEWEMGAYCKKKIQKENSGWQRWKKWHWTWVLHLIIKSFWLIYKLFRHMNLKSVYIASEINFKISFTSNINILCFSNSYSLRVIILTLVVWIPSKIAFLQVTNTSRFVSEKSWKTFSVHAVCFQSHLWHPRNQTNTHAWSYDH